MDSLESSFAAGFSTAVVVEIHLKNIGWNHKKIQSKLGFELLMFYYV